MSYLLGFVIVFSIFVVFYFFLLNTGYLILLILASMEVIYHRRLPNFDICEGNACEFSPSVSILVPAYNEENTIVESLNSLRNLDYPNLEIIVVNDGSTDNTIGSLKKSFNLVSITRSLEKKIDTEPVRGVKKSLRDERLIVIDKENGGKADALNAGINYSRSDLFIAIDADSLIEKGALKKLVRPYLMSDKRVIGIGGIVRVANNCEIVNGEIKTPRVPKKLLPSIQVMEYLRAFLFGRSGWSKINCLPIVSGAFGLFEKEAVIDIGGYRNDTVGEDMDLVIRLQKIMKQKKEDYEVSFIPDPVCWTEVPESRKVLGRQRNRWQRGLIESLIYNKNMLFNPKYGLLGTVTLPFFLFFEMLGPMVEITGYFVFGISYYFGWIDTSFALLFVLLAIVYSLLLSLFSLLLEEYTLKRYERPIDRLKLVLMAFLENFGFRQLHSWWRLKGIIDYLRKKKSWGKMERKGFKEK